MESNAFCHGQSFSKVLRNRSPTPRHSGVLFEGSVSPVNVEGYSLRGFRLRDVAVDQW